MSILLVSGLSSVWLLDDLRYDPVTDGPVLETEDGITGDGFLVSHIYIVNSHDPGRLRT